MKAAHCTFVLAARPPCRRVDFVPLLLLSSVSCGLTSSSPFTPVALYFMTLRGKPAPFSGQRACSRASGNETPFPSRRTRDDARAGRGCGGVWGLLAVVYALPPL